jgi:hypothetical protein
MALIAQSVWLDQLMAEEDEEMYAVLDANLMGILGDTGQSSVEDSEDDSEEGDFPFSASITPIMDTMHAASPQTNSKAVTLPVEIWERILINVDPFYMHKMSQLSQQHLAITKSSFFRARYFYTRHMPCQAIYHASCRPKLFTNEVLQALLSLGAVLSRYLCQSVMQRYMNINRQRTNSRWTVGLSTAMVLTMMNEGVRLYGDSFNMQSSDGTDIKTWADSLDRFPTLTDAIREKLVKGRFAPYFNEDVHFQAHVSHTPVANAVAYHPELLQVLLDNGYEFDKSDHDRM